MVALRAAVRLEEVASEEVARWPQRAAVEAQGELAVALRVAVRLEKVASEEVARWPLRAAVQAQGELVVALSWPWH